MLPAGPLVRPDGPRRPAAVLNQIAAHESADDSTRFTSIANEINTMSACSTASAHLRHAGGRPPAACGSDGTRAQHFGRRSVARPAQHVGAGTTATTTTTIAMESGRASMTDIVFGSVALCRAPHRRFHVQLPPCEHDNLCQCICELDREASSEKLGEGKGEDRRGAEGQADAESAGEKRHELDDACSPTASGLFRGMDASATEEDSGGWGGRTTTCGCAAHLVRCSRVRPRSGWVYKRAFPAPTRRRAACDPGREADEVCVKALGVTYDFVGFAQLWALRSLENLLRGCLLGPGLLCTCCRSAGGAIALLLPQPTWGCTRKAM